jgi:intracellular sulfur oxidation DsrE/DsrF family protein
MKTTEGEAMFRKTAAALALVFASFAAWAEDKVVYHFDSGLSQATKGLRNMRNHLDTDPKTKIVAVAHAEGVDFLMEGAKTANGQEFAALVQDLENRGVVFEICEITLKNRNLKKEQFILGPGYTPSGVQRIASLQAREHYVYIKP